MKTDPQCRGGPPYASRSLVSRDLIVGTRGKKKVLLANKKCPKQFGSRLPAQYFFYLSGAMRHLAALANVR